MILAAQLGSPPQDEGRDRRWWRRLLLLLLLLVGCFLCMLLAAQIALWRLRATPLQRDVRSVIEIDYGAGERRAAPLVPQVIEDIKKELDLEALRPTLDVRAMTVAPVVEILIETPIASAVAQVTTAPGTAVPPPSPTPAPQDTTSPQASDTPSQPTDPADSTGTQTPSPSVTPTGSSTPSPTGSPTPTPTGTPTPTPTGTPTPTPTGSSTPLPTETLTPLPTATPTPLPTDTPTPLPTVTPTSPPPTVTPTSPPPLILEIVPAATVQGDGDDPDIGVTIIGENFVAPAMAWLGDVGQNIMINVLDVTANVINGMLSPNIPVGVYALTVQNADLQSSTLSPAFVVYPGPSPLPHFITTFGRDAPASKGDRDHVQIIFFEVPDTAPDNLYIRIFDADTGGMYDEPDDPLAPTFNTVLTMTLRGGAQAFTHPDARAHEPGPAGIRSGVPITQRVIGVDGTLDDTWLTLPVSREQGEIVGASRVFKLVVKGGDGDDGNWYQVALSALADDNMPVDRARIFAYSWCVGLADPYDDISLYIYVPFDADTVTQFNFDFDASPGASIDLTTPLRNLPISPSGLSGQADVASESFLPFTGERASTWTARYVTGDFPISNNNFSLWFASKGVPLAIFTAPTLVSPPP